MSRAVETFCGPGIPLRGHGASRLIARGCRWPEHISQRAWEEKFAWPPNDEPPYLPLGQRILRAAAAYTAAVFVILVLLQLFSPFPVLRWIAAAAGFSP